jgi:predicted dienelactone hydrolase
MQRERNVGCRAIEVRDASRGLAIAAWLLYPTRAPAQRAAIGPWPLDLAIDAPIDPGGPFPLVAISHGNGASPWTQHELIAHLVRSGFAVAALEHPGNCRSDNSLGRTDGVMLIENLLRRPHHLRLVIDAAFADGALGPHLAASAGVGVIGTSIGGYTAAAIAGGRAQTFPDDVEAAARRAPDAATLARLVPLATERDPRVRAAVLLVPALAFFAAPGALAAVDAPLLVRSGALDPICPPAQIAHALRDHARVDHVTVPGAGHFSFLSPFPAALASLPPASDPPGFDRASYFPTLARDVTAFLRAALTS